MKKRNSLRVSRLLPVVLLLLLPLIALAEQKHSDYLFKHVTIADGLTSSQVNAICKDSRGFMWFGTSSGLNRFDGYNVRTYKSDYTNNSALPDGYIESIQEDVEGNLWIGTASGYVVMNPITELFDRSVQQRLSRAAGNVDPKIIFIDSHKNMWIYATDGRVYYYKSQQQLTYSFDQGEGQRSLPQGNITGICESAVGAAVVYDNGTVCNIDGEHQIVTWTNNVLTRNSVPRDNYSVGIDSYDNIFVYSANRSYIYDAYTRDWTQSLAEFASRWGCNWELGDAIITGMREDQNNFIWLSTDRAGLLLLDCANRTFRRHMLRGADTRSLPTNHLQTLYIDDSNLLWVGTLRYGVSYWGFGLYRFILERAGEVNGISEAPDGNIWLATRDYGLVRRNTADTTFTRFGRQAGLSDNVITCVLAAKDGSVWGGTSRFGLNRLTKNGVQTFRHIDGNVHSLANDNINALCEDNNGNIWIATHGGGLQCFNVERGTFSTFNVSNGKLPSNIVTTLCCRGTSLVAGTADGIAVVNLSNNQVEVYRGTRSGNRHFSNLYITQVLIDSRGLIWVGTRDGLNLYNKPNDIVQVFSREQGIPNDMICGLAEDSYKHIWVTTAGGVCRLVPQAGTNDDGEYSVYVYNYTQADGLQGMEFNPNSICTARDGKVYMGGLNGLNWINIGATEARNRETKVIFSELVFEGKRIGVGESIGDRVILTSRINDISTLTLPSYMRSFAIEMSVSNYYRCDHPQFMYMLEGLDGVWRPGDPLIHGVRFNNLPSGKYVLHVKATNDLGQMAEDEHVLTIVIERPWWLSWWAITFYVIIILLVLGAIFFGIPWLRRKIVSSKEERLLYEKRNEALRSVMLLLVAPINKIKEQVRKLEPLLTTPAQREIADTIRHIEDELHEELKNAQNEDVQAMLPDELRDHSAVDEAFDEEGAPLANDVEVDNASNLVPLASKRERPKRSIYLVDSDKDIAEYIADSLKNSFDFTLFATGAELLAAMAERRPDLILAYEALPDMRGSELCVQIKREKSLARIPFVLMLETAMQASEMEKHGITVAADDYVIHFFDLVALRVRCSKLMGEPVSDESPMEEAMLTADAMLDGVGELLRHHVREYVKVNISNPKLPLEDLCDAIGVPMPQLFRKIETLTGSTPAEFIRDIRLAEAATLFKSTDIMPIDVALEVGFPNIATFNRFFSEKYGMTPMEFRDKNHGEA